MIHLVDIWKTGSTQLHNGREFLSRKAFVCLRTSTVRQIGEILQLGVFQEEAQQVVILFSLREGGPQAVFQADDRIKVPEFSFLDFVIAQKSERCDDDQCFMPMLEDVASSEEQPPGLRHEGNTATSAASVSDRKVETMLT